MIGYDRLGQNGRFGNQLFQFAALRGIAAHHGYEWCIPPEDHHNVANYGIHYPFKKKKNTGFINSNVSPQAMSSKEALAALNPDTPTYADSVSNFDEDLFNNFPDGANLDGYLQTERYFKHIEDEIREEFEIIDEIVEPCKEFISQFDDIIFLHVRRGDMVNLQDYHCVMSPDYFKRALEHFDENVTVLVCSDDPEWCLKQEVFGGDRFLVNIDVPEFDHYHLDADGQRRKSKVPYIDFCMMTLCNGGILSASTLGWWGAWLQKDRTNPVIVPENWYGPKANNNTCDLYPDGWTMIPN